MNKLVWSIGGMKLTGENEVLGKQVKQCTYDITLRHIRVTTLAVEKQ